MQSAKTINLKNQTGGTIPLPMIGVGTPASIETIRGREKDIRFLESLGFVAGSTVSIISELNGNLIVNIKNTRIGIGRSLAMKIFVRMDNSHDPDCHCSYCKKNECCTKRHE